MYRSPLLFRSYLGLIDGHGADRESFDRAMSMGTPSDQADVSPVPFAWHTWIDEFDTARTVLLAAVGGASARGDELSVQAFLCQLAAIECWTGNWARADEYATQVMDLTDRIASPAYLGSALFARGYVDAHLGHVGEARTAGMRLLELFDDGNRGQGVFAHWLLGFTALVEQDLASADRELSHAADLTDLMRLREPVRTRFHPDLSRQSSGAATSIGQRCSSRDLMNERGHSPGRGSSPLRLGARAFCSRPGVTSIPRLQRCTQRCAITMTWTCRLSVPGPCWPWDNISRRRRENVRRAWPLRSQVRFERLGAAMWVDRVDRELARIPTHRAARSRFLRPRTDRAPWSRRYDQSGNRGARVRQP